MASTITYEQLTPLRSAQEPILLNRLLRMRLVRILLVIAVVIGLERDFHDTKTCGGIDLRNRVVGARLLAAGINPYTYFWQPGDPEEYVDVHAVSGKNVANRITVTPAVLAWHMTFACRHYRIVQWTWLAIQWLAFALLTAALTLAAPRDKRQLVLFTVLAVWACSVAWRMHIGVGQVYVTYALLWSGALLFGQNEGTSCQLASGFMLGLAAVLRPTCVLTLPPLALARRWWVLSGAVLGATALLVTVWPWADLSIWRSYSAHMEDVCRYDVDETFFPSHWSYPEPAPSGTIEGLDNMAKSPEYGWTADKLHLRATQVLPPDWRTAALKGAFLIFLAWYHLRLICFWKQPPSLPIGLLAGTVVAIAADFFIPCTRNIYNNILWAVPVSILVAHPRFNELLGGVRGALLAFALLMANGVLSVGGCDSSRFSSYLLLVLMVHLSLRAVAIENPPVETHGSPDFEETSNRYGVPA